MERYIWKDQYNISFEGPHVRMIQKIKIDQNKAMRRYPFFLAKDVLCNFGTTFSYPLYM